MGVEQPDVSSPQAGGLADRYAAAFAAHLDDGGEPPPPHLSYHLYYHTTHFYLTFLAAAIYTA